MRRKPPKEKPPATWAEALERFLERCRELRRSPKTLRAYGGELARFGTWFEKELEGPATFADIQAGDIRFWMQHLAGRKLEPASVNAKLAALRSMCKWAQQKEWMKAVEFPAPVEKPEDDIRWLERKEERRIVRAADKGDFLRDRALIQFFLMTGARIEEASMVRASDLQLGERKGRALIHGKGRRDRYVPLDVDVLKLLKQLVATLPADREPDPFVFRGQRGQRMTPAGLHRVVVKYAEAAKLPGITAHNLRHTFAKRQIDAGTPISVVASLMGHKNINTTFRYVKPGEQDKEAAIRSRSAAIADHDDDRD
jgi:integrase/recombinase XerD